MEKKILEILSEVKPGVDFEGRTDLIAGVLASFDIISLVSELNDEFDVEISVVDLVPENFNSVEAMAKMIKRLEDED
jgi:D-alanine--poly(phosphoribitol) ligase subunit 2